MKTILEHARMLSRDRLSLGFNDTFPEMIEKLREELKELEEVPARPIRAMSWLIAFWYWPGCSSC